MTDVDVVVVGAGLAGLACARDVRCEGRSVVVLEATHRVGGRARSFIGRHGESWELGAQVVHGNDNPIWQFLGREQAQSYRNSDFRCVFGGVSRPISALGRLAVPPWLINRVLGSMPSAAGTVGTVGDWLATRSCDQVSRSIAASWLEQEWAASPTRLDRHEVLQILSERPEPDEQFVPTGGFGALVQHLSADLSIRTGAPVRRISRTVGGVRVRIDGATDLLAGQVVLTVPPWTIGQQGIELEDLPAGKTAALPALCGGDAAVAVVELSKVADQDVTVFDADSALGFLRTQAGSGCVQIVAKGVGAAALRSLLADRSRLVEVLAVALPWTAGAAVTEIEVADWGADRFVRGAFTVPVTGAALARSIWAKPWGAVHFAGEATCGADGVARAHGALLSGLRAAQDIRARDDIRAIDARDRAPQLSAPELSESGLPESRLSATHPHPKEFHRVHCR